MYTYAPLSILFHNSKSSVYFSCFFFFYYGTALFLLFTGEPQILWDFWIIIQQDIEEIIALLMHFTIKLKMSVSVFVQFVDLRDQRGGSRQLVMLMQPKTNSEKLGIFHSKIRQFVCKTYQGVR